MSKTKTTTEKEQSLVNGLTWKDVLGGSTAAVLSYWDSQKEKKRNKSITFVDGGDIRFISRHLQSVGTPIREDLFLQTFSTSLVTTTGMAIAELVGTQANATNIFLSE